MRKTLVIVAHEDDEALSTGGLIARRASRDGVEVSVLTVFGRSYNYGQGDQHREEQAQAFRRSCGFLGVSAFGSLGLEEGEPARASYYYVLNKIETLLSSFGPTEVVIHDDQDRNQDHQWLSNVCKIALRPWNIPQVKRVLMCQSPDGLPKETNYYVSMTPMEVELKRSAVESYARESRMGVHPRSPENLDAWHALCGSFCNAERAEPYRLYYQRE